MKNSLTLDDYNVQELTGEQLVETEGGAVPAVVVGVALVGGAFVAGLAVGALAAWAVYEITH
ncbi:class IIb bacteriocin, lactobin A/cerein 7B family [Sinomicrobium oceani]|uniref:Class IIb bacteriocin, lactobin A/cerein 7B family n=1 Tax=Sinomicrobium oceani TaxID=1150368 RepID=A0A1K1NM26_9FLAO|nr:class IIb bacteriocin, lactobin A/cerein 7B family [Sinomicrobium oceani]SFW36351.1 class IIb bacteriocin, lactobin A/cerein 7B family [Sinomicrobium oceani]